MDVSQYLNESKNVLHGDPWYGESVLRTLKNLSIDQINRNPIYGVHTIGQIVKHMLNWRTLAINKLLGKDFDIKMDSKEDWDPAFKIDRIEEWENMVSEFLINHQSIINTIYKRPPEWFQEKVVGRDYSNEYLISGILEHDIYHLGQIRLILKILAVEDNKS